MGVAPVARADRLKGGAREDACPARLLVLKIPPRSHPSTHSPRSGHSQLPCSGTNFKQPFPSISSCSRASAVFRRGAERAGRGSGRSRQIRALPAAPMTQRLRGAGATRPASGAAGLTARTVGAGSAAVTAASAAAGWAAAAVDGTSRERLRAQNLRTWARWVSPASSARNYPKQAADLVSPAKEPTSPRGCCTDSPTSRKRPAPALPVPRPCISIWRIFQS